MENEDYLQQVAFRVATHNKALQNAKTYLIKKNVKEYDKIESCLIVSQVWAADKLGTSLTQGDLLMFLGNDNDVTSSDMYQDLSLTDRMKGKTLNQCLDFVLNAEGSIWDD